MESFWPRLRQTLRNPSALQAVSTLAVVAAILAAVFGPTLVRRTVDAYREVKDRRPVFAAPIETHINPWLHLQARRMKAATQPYQWRAVSFRHGPCHPDNTRQLPSAKYGPSVIEACSRLDDIQARYAADCAEVDGCAIPQAALSEIDEVVQRLDDTFGEAGLVEPYSRDEEE